MNQNVLSQVDKIVHDAVSETYTKTHDLCDFNKFKRAELRPLLTEAYLQGQASNSGGAFLERMDVLMQTTLDTKAKLLERITDEIGEGRASYNICTEISYLYTLIEAMHTAIKRKRGL